MTDATPMPPDVRNLIDALRTRSGPAADGLRHWFEPGKEIVIARAPGRLDVMGGIADYSGALVLQLPIAEATLAAVQSDKDRVLRILSCTANADASLRSSAIQLQEVGPACRAGPERATSPRSFAIPLQELENSSYQQCHQHFQRDPAHGWAAYVAGAVLVLIQEKGVQLKEGLRVAVLSRVPEGKGVASSAALEVAAMAAIAGRLGVVLEPVEMAILCQKVENLVVGAPCGVMDQMAAACGRENRLLALVCQPTELRGHVEIPADVAFWGIDSGIRHAVSGSDYTSVRVGAFMGYRIIAEMTGFRTRPTGRPDTVVVEDSRWNGYLANIAPRDFEQEFAPRLPATLDGHSFLDRYSGTTDPVTRVDPERVYAVLQPAAHAVYENARVVQYRDLLGNLTGDESLDRLGRLMYQSHESYSACGLGSDGTDLLIDLVRNSEPSSGLFGAKITGGGSGGTVAILGRSDADTAVRRIARQYAEQSGREPYVFSGSSNGAAYTGCFRL